MDRRKEGNKMIEKEDLKGYFDFLEDLRKSGLTNMLGARPYIQTAFPDLSDKEAKEILVKWLQSFRLKARDAE
jgi:hypothetical protein